jgi:NADH:ubiquinone oxidoreductase subunit D
VNYDLRKVNPHYFYDDIEFEIPLGINGQCYDRYLVRVEEIFQSISIINQLLDNLPLGSFISKDAQIFLPPKEDVYKESEALIQHHKMIKEGVKLPRGEFYNSIESPNGELGVHLKCDGDSRAERFKLRTPSFYSGQCFSDVIEGGEAYEIPLVISSLNLSLGEIDR